MCPGLSPHLGDISTGHTVLSTPRAALHTSQTARANMHRIPHPHGMSDSLPAVLYPQTQTYKVALLFLRLGEALATHEVLEEEGMWGGWHFLKSRRAATPPDLVWLEPPGRVTAWAWTQRVRVEEGMWGERGVWVGGGNSEVGGRTGCGGGQEKVWVQGAGSEQGQGCRVGVRCSGGDRDRKGRMGKEPVGAVRAVPGQWLLFPEPWSLRAGIIKCLLGHTQCPLGELPSMPALPDFPEGSDPESCW